jgi:hypothetical protein
MQDEDTTACLLQLMKSISRKKKTSSVPCAASASCAEPGRKLDLASLDGGEAGQKEDQQDSSGLACMVPEQSMEVSWGHRWRTAGRTSARHTWHVFLAWQTTRSQRLQTREKDVLSCLDGSRRKMFTMTSSERRETADATLAA